MAKNKSNEVAENLDDTVESTIETSTETPAETNSQPAQTVVKKSGTGLSLLAILIALGVGGAGYYLGQQQVSEIQQKLTALEGKSLISHHQLLLRVFNLNRLRLLKKYFRYTK
ncbi:HemX [Rodentibacter pneumotropicus]|uniref:HemX n=1 Tax=Rodentibacter pneumotropicus TaxID=758 RepID=A0A448MJK0_9PAST|nr:HemX [Rodentibacter pneumotropicus]